jgi:hypothetical protein
MPIIMMVRRERYEEFLAGKLPEGVTVRQVDDYQGHETGRVYHEYSCPQDRLFSANADMRTREGWQAHYFTDCPHCGAKAKGEPLFMETSRVGLVVELRERNYRDDSDFYARVWNPETKSVDIIEYASTRGWSYPNYATSADATPETMAAYLAWEQEQARLARERWEAQERARKEAERAHLAALQDKFDGVPPKGTVVEVVNNRSKKARKGDRGTVTWKGVSKFDPDKIVVGVELAPGQVVYLNADAVRAVAP